jgi:CelD/BcsL family acetyltransferase involved in cellulose biosynthesis
MLAARNPTDPGIRLSGRADPADGIRRCELIDPLADGRWEAFVAAALGARAVHHRTWLALLARTYGQGLLACCLVGPTGEIRAGAPMMLVRRRLRRPRLVCLPLADRCAPLPEPDEDPVLAARLIEELDTLRRVLRVRLEIRGPIAPAVPTRVLARHHQHAVPLEPDVDTVVGRFPRRAEILAATDRARRAGLVVERRTDTRALDELHRLSALRPRGYEPAPPRRLTLGFAHLFDRGLGFVALVRSRGRAVDAMLFTTFNRVLTCNPGARVPATPRDPPRDLLLVEIIRWACAAGMRTLDLGRTLTDDEQARAFKLSWGAEERLLEYHERGRSTA